MSAGEPIFLCRLEDLPDPGARGFRVGLGERDAIFLVRHGPRVKAWRDACPHVDGAPLAWRKDAYLSADGQAIVCYGHGAVFDPDNGLCVRGPCKGQSLAPVAIRQEGDGGLWLRNIE